MASPSCAAREAFRHNLGQGSLHDTEAYGILACQYVGLAGWDYTTATACTARGQKHTCVYIQTESLMPGATLLIPIWHHLQGWACAQDGVCGLQISG